MPSPNCVTSCAAMARLSPHWASAQAPGKLNRATNPSAGPVSNASVICTSCTTLHKDVCNRQVAYSNWSRGWRHRHYTGDLLIDTFRYVEESDQRQLSFIERNGHRTYALFYEALVKDPRPQLEGLCAFLGADWHEALLSWWHTQHDFGTEDPIVRGTRGFEPSLGNYRAWDQEQRMAAREILDDIISRLGYTEYDGILVHSGSLPRHQRPRRNVTAQSTAGN